MIAVPDARFVLSIKLNRNKLESAYIQRRAETIDWHREERDSWPRRVPKAAERSKAMSGPEFDEMSGGRRKKSDASQTQLAFVAEGFLELFKLLEQYAPVWYTEEHHNRAVAAVHVLQEAGLLAKEAWRSQNAS